MKKEAIIYGASGLIVGMIVMWAVASVSVNNNYQPMMQMMGMKAPSSSMDMGTDMSMSAMQTELQGKRGDTFDQEFMDMMIPHHQGAIDMARMAAKQAKHDEIKKMAKDIITGQSKDIATMRLWQTKWSYPSMPASHAMGR